MGITSTSKGIALTETYFAPSPRGVSTSAPLPSACRMHLHPGWEFPRDYYTQASTSSRALISLAAPEFPSAPAAGAPRWSHLRLHSRVELPAASPGCARGEMA